MPGRSNRRVSTGACLLPASRSSLEGLEAQRKPVSIWPVCRPGRRVNGAAFEVLERFQERAVLLVEQSFGDVQAVVRVDTNEVRVECSVVDLGQRQAVGDHWLAKFFVLVRDNVRRIQKQRLRYSRNCAATVIGMDDGLAKG